MFRGQIEAGQEVYKTASAVSRVPESQKPAVAQAVGPHPPPLTDAGDTVLSQHCPVVTEADDLVALRVHVTLIYLTVAAVQVMLNIHFPMAFHHW